MTECPESNPTIRLDSLPQRALRCIAENLDLPSLLSLTETNRQLCGQLSNDATLWDAITRKHLGEDEEGSQPKTRTAFAEACRRKRNMKTECMEGKQSNSTTEPRLSPALARSSLSISEGCVSHTTTETEKEHNASKQRMGDIQTTPMPCDMSQVNLHHQMHQEQTNESTEDECLFGEAENMDDWFSKKLGETKTRRRRDRNQRHELAKSVMLGGPSRYPSPAVVVSPEPSRQSTEHSMPSETEASDSFGKHNRSLSVAQQGRPNSTVEKTQQTTDKPVHKDVRSQRDKRVSCMISQSMRAIPVTAQFNESDKGKQQTPMRREYHVDSYRFETTLMKPECKNLRLAVENFFRNFEKASQGIEKNEIALVRAMLRDVESEMHRLPTWKDLPPNHFITAKEDMQRTIFTRLYPIIFEKEEYHEQDVTITKHLSQLRAVMKPLFLDLDTDILDNAFIKGALEKLKLLDSYKTPLEKVTCTWEASQKVSSAIGIGKGATGADDFLPTFIFVVLQANIKTPHSTIQFVEHYLDPEEKYGEGYYFFTHLISALAYLGDLTLESVVKGIQKKEATRQQQLAASGQAEILDAPTALNLQLREGLQDTKVESTEDGNCKTATQAQHIHQPTTAVTETVFSATTADPLANPKADTLATHNTQEDMSTMKTTSPYGNITDEREIQSYGTGDSTGVSEAVPSSATPDEDKEDAEFPPALFEDYESEGDSKFLAQLHFLDTERVPTDPEEISLLIAEYKKLAEVAKAHLPLVTKQKTWRREPGACRTVIELPEGTQVTSLLVSHRRVWAGLQSGEVAACSPQLSEVCGRVALQKAPVVKMVALDTTIWCINSWSTAAVLDPATMRAPGKSYTLHDKRHSAVVEALYDGATDTVWSVGVADPSRSGRRQRAESQLTRVHVASGAQKSFVVPGNATSATLFRRGLWVAFDDGKVVSYNPTTGASTGALGPLVQPKSQSQIVLTSPGPEQMWLSTGDTLQAMTGETGIDLHRARLAGLSGRIVAVAPSCIAWNRAAEDSSDGDTGEPRARIKTRDRHEDCHVVVTVDVAGTICVWNTLDRTCEAMIETTLREPMCFACSPRTEHGQAIWAAAQMNTVDCWSFA